MKLDVLIKALKGIKRGAEAELTDTLKDNEGVIEEMQRNRLSKGKDAEGNDLKFLNPRTSKIGTHYTLPYQRKKKKAGGKTDRVDLKLDGTFHNSIDAIVKKSQLTILSRDTNKGKLKGIDNNYAEPLGFDPKQRAAMDRIITNRINKYVGQILRLQA